MMAADELLALVAEGDQAAFRKLYDLFQVRVYNTALSYMRNVEDAEEVTQDVFTRIYRSAGNFRGNSDVSTWVYRIAVNTALNHLQKRKRRSLFQWGNPDQEPVDFVHPGVRLEHQEHVQALLMAIHSLPDRQRTALILSFIEELPRQEVADVMELSLKAVESLLMRGKQNLKENLKKMYPDRRIL